MNATFLDLIWVSGSWLVNTRSVLVVTLGLLLLLLLRPNKPPIKPPNTRPTGPKREPIAPPASVPRKPPTPLTLLLLPPVTLTTPPSTSTVLTQLSENGFNSILPINSTMLNGLTFSTLDANGWFNQSTSS